MWHYDIDAEGKPEFDENFETKMQGLYLAGDIAVKSGGSIAIALNHAYPHHFAYAKK